MVTGKATGVGLSFGEIFAETYPLLYLIIFIPLFWISIANGAKRCHDLGHNGWWQLIPLYCFWMAFQDGQSIANEYGPSPKDTEIAAYKDYDIHNTKSRQSGLL